MIRTVGAGDVKLLGALGALVGPQALVSIAIYGALVGGAISVVMLVSRGRLQASMYEIMTRPTRLTRSGATAPYGVAIASGVYLSMLLPSVIG
jgi:prepilin peptidase CpaA